jgi:hypothetical protein
MHDGKGLTAAMLMTKTENPHQHPLQCTMEKD